MHEYRNTGLLWQVFELLNNDLGLILGRDRPFLDIQDHVKRFSSRNGYSGSEYIFRDNAGYGSGRSFPGSLECNAARLPTKRVSQAIRGSHELEVVRGNVIGLDYVLRILVGRVAPPADFDIYFAMILVGV